jgi:dihydroorotate dehydrogenase
LEKLEAGADLIQIYTGFIYEGPGFVKRINEAILRAR